MIDAVVGGDASGTVHVLDHVDLGVGPRPVSSHGITVLEAIAVAARFNPALKVILIGISIDRPRSLGEGLSPKVAASVTEATKRVTHLVSSQKVFSGPFLCG